MLYLADKRSDGNFHDKSNENTLITKNQKSSKQQNNRSGSRKKSGEKSKGKGFLESQQSDLTEAPDEGTVDENSSPSRPQRTQKVHCNQRPDMSSPSPLLEVVVQKASTFEATPQKNYRNLSGAMSAPNITTNDPRKEVKNNICNHCNKLGHLSEDCWWVQ